MKESIKVFGENFKQGDIVEVVQRLNGKYRTFCKYIVESNPKNKEISKISNNILNKVKNIDNEIGNIANIVDGCEGLLKLNSVISIVNLCTTVAGFIIMNEKLKDIECSVDEIKDIIQKQYGVELKEDFTEVQGDYKMLLDEKRHNKRLGYRELEDIVNRQHTVLQKLIESFYNYTTQSDNESLLLMILVLSSMMSETIKYFNEEYFEEYSDEKDIKKKFYPIDEWMADFDMILSKQFINKAYELYFIDKDLNQSETSIAIKAIEDKIVNNIRDINNDIELLKRYKNPEQFKEMLNEIDKYLVEQIQKEVNKGSYSTKTKNIINRSISEMQLEIA